MTKRIRTILFSLCVFLFILITPPIILYSQGYRFDLGNKKLTQTGGLFLKIEPKQVDIFTDEKLAKKTDLFFGSALIENLLPKKYKVSIKKDGYQNWEKTLEVKEKEVTEVKNILLIPENINFQNLVKGVKNLFFSKDEKKLILKKEAEKNEYLTLFDLDRNVESILIENKDISRKKVEFLSLEWSFDSKRILLTSVCGEEPCYFILDLEKTSPISPIPLNFSGVPEKFSFNPSDSNKLLFLQDDSVFEIDCQTKAISNPFLTDVITFEILSGNIYYLNSSGFLFSFNLSNKNQQKINTEPLSFKEGAYYKISLSLSEIFIKEENSIFWFNPNTKEFEKIFEPFKNIEFSRDSKKIMFFNDYEIWIRYLTVNSDQTAEKSGENKLISRFSEKINNCFWLNNYYLIFNTGDKIKIAEIDDRDKIQIWDLSSFNSPELFWNQNNKELYILSGENFYKSDKIIK